MFLQIYRLLIFFCIQHLNHSQRVQKCADELHPNNHFHQFVLLLVQDHQDQNSQERKSENSVKDQIHVIQKMLNFRIEIHDLNVK
jgi:hypothetical protein